MEGNGRKALIGQHVAVGGLVEVAEVAANALLHGLLVDAKAEVVGLLTQQRLIDQRVEHALLGDHLVDQLVRNVLGEAAALKAPLAGRFVFEKALGDVVAVDGGGDWFGHREQVDGAKPEHRQHEDDDANEYLGKDALRAGAHLLQHHERLPRTALDRFQGGFAWWEAPR